MGEAYFYHVAERPLEAVLRQLLGRILQQGWRVELRGTDAGAMAALDAALWLPEDSFLPHGLAGGPHDPQQPVLLTVGPGSGGRECLVAVDGAEVAPAEVRAAARACIVFDGRTGTERARAQWRTLMQAGVGLKYWAEEAGGWALRQERAAAT